MSQFEELLAQLQSQADEQETMAKSLPAEDGEDDEAIQAAAGEEGAEEGADDSDEDELEDGENEEPLGKSLTAMVDGEEVEAIDATELIKSLMGRLDGQESVLAKALETTLGTIQTQGEMIKSLSARVEKLAGQGRGRKAVLSVVDKPGPGETPLTKSEAAVQPGEIMAKALSAQKAGNISAQDVARCEISFQSGVPFPADVLARF
jgi:hypothetical protein